MPPSTTSGPAEDILDELIQIIRQEYDNFCSELCETDRMKFQRVNENLYANVRTKLSKKHDLPGSASSPESKGEPGNPTLAVSRDDRDYTSDISEAINTPLETSSGIEPRNDSSIRPRRRTPPPPPSPREAAIARLLPEIAIPSPVSVSSTSSAPPQRRPPPAPPSSREEAIARIFSQTAATRRDSVSSTSSIPPQRRSPPAPPAPQRPGTSSSLLLSDSTSSSPVSGSHRRSQSVNGLVSPQSRMQSPIINIGPSSSSSDPAINQLTRQINMLVSEILKDLPLANQPHGQQGQRRSKAFVTKTNCVDISDSTVEGLTMNNGGSYNSGAVIHKMLSPVSPQRVPRY